METGHTDPPTLSVLMSVFNETPEMLTISIESILNQSYTDFEFIIIIDNPDSQLLNKVINSYAEKDERIVVLYNERNIGLANSLNRGIQIARGKYIARMDADDISLEDRFNIEINHLEENKDIDLVYSGVIQINENGMILSRKMTAPKNAAMLMKALDYNNIIVHPSVMFKTSVAREAGGYNDYLTSQDYDLWLRLKQRGCLFGFIESPLLLYRVRENSITSNKAVEQYLSYRYAQYTYKNNKSFHKQQYLRFIAMKKENITFVNHMKNFRKSFQYNKLRKIAGLLYYAMIDRECRNDFANYIKFKRCVKSLPVKEYIGIYGGYELK